MKPLALDLFCGAGGVSEGLHRAGFDVTGVDIEKQKSYPFRFIRADALTFDLSGYDFIWASPPCQAFTKSQKLQGNRHPDLIAPIRKRLQTSSARWVIENVEGAPLINPIMLCGAMFPGLKVYRHRIFESNFKIEAPHHPEHKHKIAKMGRPVKPGEFMHVVGNFSGAEQGRLAMGVHWMSKNELREAIPPAYSEFIGWQLRKEIDGLCG